jgi:hypothetical protein
MRIEIKTPSPIKDNDIRGLYILAYAMSIISPRMIRASLEFLASHYGLTVIEKKS